MSDDIEGASLIFAATNNSITNNKVYKDAEEKGLPVNSVDDPANCSFYVPSLVRKGDLIVAVSTSGASPAMAAKLRRLLEQSIPSDIDEILTSLRKARSVLLTLDNLTTADRGNILKQIVNDNDLLSKLVEYSKNDKIEEFLKKFA